MPGSSSSIGSSAAIHLPPAVQNLLSDRNLLGNVNIQRQSPQDPDLLIKLSTRCQDCFTVTFEYLRNIAGEWKFKEGFQFTFLNGDASCDYRNAYFGYQPFISQHGPIGLFSRKLKQLDGEESFRPEGRAN